MEESYTIESQDDLCRSGRYDAIEKLWLRSWSISQHASGIPVHVELLENQSDTDENGRHCLWPAGLFLAKLIERKALEEDWGSLNPSVVELGSGCGLLAMTAAMLGAHTLATDRKGALPFLRRCIKRNRAVLGQSALRTKVLEWGEPLTITLPSVDFVLSSDTLYNAALHVPFASTVATLLAMGPEGARAFVANDDTSTPGSKRWAAEKRKGFVSVCLEHGLAVVREVAAHDVLPGEWSLPSIFLFELRLRDNASQCEDFQLVPRS